MDQLNGQFKVILTSLLEERECELRCELMEKLVACIHQEEDVDADFSSSLAAILSFILQEEMSKKIFPSSLDEESLEDSIEARFSSSSAICVKHRKMILNEHHWSPCCCTCRITLPVWATTSSITSKYPNSRMSLLTKNLQKCHRMQRTSAPFSCGTCDACQEDDVNMFCFILPDVCRSFESTVLSNPQFMHLTVSCVDSIQLADMICHVLRGDMRMLKKENVVQLISKWCRRVVSLLLERFLQIPVWNGKRSSKTACGS